MATWYVILDNVVTQTFEVPQGEHATIGRKAGNAIVLESPVISGIHAKIDHLEEGYLLTDMQSKNGTFVNDHPITVHWLQEGDRIRIGQHSIFFQPRPHELPIPISKASLATPPPPPPPSAWGTPGSEAPTPPAADQQDDDLLQDLEAAPKRPVLVWRKGGEGTAPLHAKLTKIGKDPSCDVVVGGFFTGKVAATIYRQADAWMLAHVEGRTKTKCNGKAVIGPVALHEFDRIEVGDATFELLFHEE